MIGMTEDGHAVAIPPAASPYSGPLPAAEVRELRGVLARSLVALGLTHQDVASLLGASLQTIERDLRKPSPPVDGSVPPDVPQGIGAPASRVPGMVEVTARLMKELREEYGPGRTNDRGEALGDLPTVRAWLDSLEARRRARPA